MSEEAMESPSFTLPKGTTFFSEFLVDILGGLMPGLFYLTGALFAVGPSLYVIYMAYSDNPNFLSFNNFKELLDSVKETPSTLWFFVFMGLVSLIYIIGQIFYRRDPKEPDKRSYLKLEKDEVRYFLKHDIRRNPREYRWSTRILFLIGLSNLASFPIVVGRKRYARICSENISQELKNNLACCSASQCEFPYPFLNDYLLQRGLDHLSQFVLWGEENPKKRSKTIINILKVRLNHYHPSKYKSTVKLEAHVRLASSTWYASWSVVKLSLASIFFLFGFSVCIRYGIKNIEPFGFSSLMNNYFLPLTFPLFALSVGGYCKRKIEQFLHYQRLKEVVTVLETVYTAFRKSPELLDPPFQLDHEPEEPALENAKRLIAERKSGKPGKSPAKKVSTPSP